MRWAGRAAVAVGLVLLVAAIWVPGLVWQLGLTGGLVLVVGFALLGQADRRDDPPRASFSSTEGIV